MKKSLILLTALLCSLFTFAASGKCGANLKWNYDKKTQTLTITGSGAMDDYKYGSTSDKTRPEGVMPWWDYKEDVTTIILPEGLTHIGNNAFLDFKKIVTCKIPKSVVSIGDGAFSFCDNLTELTISANVDTLDWGFASYTNKLKAINVAKDNRRYCSLNGVLFTKDKTVLIEYPTDKEGTTYDIPSGVKMIARSAFNGAKQLSSITIPPSVTRIGGSAFCGCGNLISIKLPEGVSTIESNTFLFCDNLTEVTIPASVTAIQSWAFGFCKELTKINIPNPDVQIHEDAFYGCSPTVKVAKKGAKVFTNPDTYESEEMQKEDDGFVWYHLRKAGKSAAKNAQKNVIIPYSRNYDYISYNHYEQMFVVTRNDKNGMCDRTGKEIIAPRYTSVHKSPDGLYYVVRDGDGYGLCNISGREYVAPRYPDLFYSADGDYILVKSSLDADAYSIYTKEGKQIVSESQGFNYQEVHKGLLWVAKDYSKNRRTYTPEGQLLANDFVEYTSQPQNTQQSSGPSRAEIAIAVMQGLAEGLSSASSSNTSNNYNSSSNTSTSNNAGVLVGNYTAYGLSKSFGNTVTHSQTFAVYRDSRGYYIIDPKWKTNNYLHANTDRTYFDYPVGAYNYRTMTSLGSDVHWFFKL